MLHAIFGRLGVGVVRLAGHLGAILLLQKLRQVAVVVALHLVVEHLALVRRGVHDEVVVQDGEDLLADARELVLHLGPVRLDLPGVGLVALRALLVLDGTKDAPGRAAGADHVLVADAEQVTLLDLRGGGWGVETPSACFLREASLARRGKKGAPGGGDRSGRDETIAPVGLKRRDHDDLTHETTAEGSKPAEISRIPPSSARPRRASPPRLRAEIVAGIVTPNEPRVVALTESSTESSLQRAFMDSTISVKIKDERSSGLRDVRSRRRDGSTARKGGSRKGGIPKTPRRQKQPGKSRSPS